MPGENLTRAEAQERAATLATESYDVELDLTRGDRVFGSTTTVRFTATPGATTFIDLIAESVEEITLNGRPVEIAAFADSRIALDGLAAANELRVVATCRYMNTGEGLHRFVDPVDGEAYLYSQFEVADSRRMFAVFEQPDLKATFAFTVTAPERWTVVSGTASAAPEPAGSSSTTWRFAPTQVISSYLTAIVAGPYHRVTGELTSADGRTIPLGVYCRASLAEHLDAEEIMDITRAGFAFYEEAFGRPYPFEKYDQLFVPEFNAGAMENAGAVTFVETYVFRSKVPEATVERRAVTILHELAHMWFGDLVTMRWWNDLWLNESFAEYASHLAAAEATRWTSAWTTFSSLEKSWAYNQDQLPSTHPIVATINDLEDVEVNFDGITYAKGASVLKQLVAWVGRDAFLEGVRRYFAKHAFSNTELKDLLVELEATSGRELASWSKVWLEQAGVTLLRPEIATEPAGDGETITSFTVVQEAPAEHPTLRPHRLVIGGYDVIGEGPQARLERTVRVELDVDGPRTEVPELVGTRRPDLVLVNDEDLAYAKVRLDERSLATAVAHLGGFAESLPRALVLGSAWDMTRDGEWAARKFIDLVLASIAAETDSSVVQVLLRQLAAALGSYTAPEARDELSATVADRLLDLARAATGGSDTQLQLVRAVAAHAVTGEQLDTLAALLDGSSALPGLAVDTDLRWALLLGLVAGGRAGEADIDAELGRDATASGHQQAARARAAVPTAANKARAWADVVESDALPNAVQSNVIAGFTQVHDRALLAPSAGAYFDVLVDVWEKKTSEMAQNIVIGLYPGKLAGLAQPLGVDVVALTEAWLAEHEDAAPALRRLVTENLDAARRAVRAQEADRRARQA
ncbi:aminopeptidase N [Georgenia sp. SYP-B2076]|uniref:aminopeptidase N n=1 Tax=Georgenia sp. SYP-B2076 TaxID=2495881 RepID=UPI000F8D26B6|nr:aminopeptidase N [Georgenia sp. SYP-B2076]